MQNMVHEEHLDMIIKEQQQIKNKTAMLLVILMLRMSMMIRTRKNKRNHKNECDFSQGYKKFNNNNNTNIYEIKKSPLNNNKWIIHIKEVYHCSSRSNS